MDTTNGPVSASPTPSVPKFDVLGCGLLFYDLVFSGLPESGIRPGEEVWTEKFGHGPGGIANFGIACTRLGLSSTLAAVLGDDQFGRLCVEDLRREGVDLGACVVAPGWSTPVTVALNYAGDRALATAGTRPPLNADELLAGRVPSARAAIAHLEEQPASWLRTAAELGCQIFAEVGWDPTGAWNGRILDQLALCAAFVPNESEAIRYTAASDLVAAAKQLAEFTPLTVVTRGRQGAVAIDSATGTYVEVPAIAVPLVDATGAGDAFTAGLVFARQRIDGLHNQLKFAVLVAGLTVARPGGASTSPRLAELARWSRSTSDPSYAFLPEVIAAATSGGPGMPA